MFLSANPDNTTQLRLAEECNLIDSRIQASQFREQFDLEQRHAVSLLELQAHLLRFRPNIVHFSGHGSEKGALVFENSEGYAEEASPKALSALFRIINEGASDENTSRDKVCCVVLSACYSLEQAKGIAKYVDCVIGISDAIKDKSATNFAASFYQALGFGQSVKSAFELGRNQLGLYEDPDEHILNLEHKAGVDPSKIFLAGPSKISADKVSDLESEKRKKNLADHCAKLLEKSNLAEEFYKFYYFDMNKDYLQYENDEPFYKYAKRIIEHLYTAHEQLYNLFAENYKSNQKEQQLNREHADRIRQDVMTILSDLGIHLGWSESRIQRISSDELETIIRYILENEHVDLRYSAYSDWSNMPHLLRAEGGQLPINDVNAGLGEKLAKSLNYLAKENQSQLKSYRDALSSKEKAQQALELGFKEFFAEIELGTTTLKGACEYCLSHDFHDEKEITRLRADLSKLYEK